MSLNQFDVLFQLLHLRLHSFFTSLLSGCVSDHTQALVLAMEFLPVALQAVENLLPIVANYLEHLPLLNALLYVPRKMLL